MSELSKNLIPKLINRSNIVQHLPYAMTRIIIQSQVLAVKYLKNFSP